MLHCRKMARHQRQRAANVVRQQERCNERRCRLALAAWMDYLCTKQALQHNLCAAVDRLAMLKLETAFCAWAQHAHDRRLQHQNAENILHKVPRHPLV